MFVRINFNRAWQLGSLIKSSNTSKVNKLLEKYIFIINYLLSFVNKLILKFNLAASHSIDFLNKIYCQSQGPLIVRVGAMHKGIWKKLPTMYLLNNFSAIIGCVER